MSKKSTILFEPIHKLIQGSRKVMVVSMIQTGQAGETVEASRDRRSLLKSKYSSGERTRRI